MSVYQKYQDSCVYYLGKLPTHWQVKRAKTLFKKEQRPIRPNDGVVTCFRDGQVTLRTNRRTEGFTNSLKEIGYQGVRKGDLVIHNMDAFAGSIGVSESDGKMSPVCSICTPIHANVLPIYYALYLRALARDGFVKSLAKGIRERSTDFRYGEFKELFLPLPPLPEQEAIVRYLDAETAKIDKAIAAEEKMIALLQERREIIINDAVGGGDFSHAEAKCARAEGVGLPEREARTPKGPQGVARGGGWEIKRFKSLFSTCTGISFTKAELVEEGCPVLSYGQIHSKENSGVGVNRKLIRHIPAALTLEKSLAYKGDFLFADTSEDLEGCGNCICIDTEEPIYAGSHVILARKHHEQIGRFLAYEFACISWRKQLRRLVNGVKVYSVTQTILNSVPVWIPPLPEQERIVKYLDAETGKIDRAIEVKRRQISLLRERREIVINEVVTGKVKVA